MRDLFMQHGSGYWYSLIAASPRPESGESVNVGLLIGNGRAFHLEYLETLPRLCGIAGADEIAVLRAVLKEMSLRVERGIDLDMLSSMVGPQLIVRERRRLRSAPSDALFKQLVDRFLKPPLQPERGVNINALVRKSVARLDVELERAGTRRLEIVRRVRPNRLYQNRLERYVPYRVPSLARAIRSVRRDLLIDTLIVEDQHEPSMVRAAAGRIGQAFYTYDEKLRALIHSHANIDIHIVGVLPPSLPDESRETRALRDWVKDSWHHHARVIDGNTESVGEALGREIEWVSESIA